MIKTLILFVILAIIAGVSYSFQGVKEDDWVEEYQNNGKENITYRHSGARDTQALSPMFVLVVVIQLILLVILFFYYEHVCSFISKLCK